MVLRVYEHVSYTHTLRLFQGEHMEWHRE